MAIAHCLLFWFIPEEAINWSSSALRMRFTCRFVAGSFPCITGDVKRIIQSIAGICIQRNVFATQPFDCISRYGPMCEPLGNDNSESCTFQLVGACVHNKMFRPRTGTHTKNGWKIIRFNDTPIGRKISVHTTSWTSSGYTAKRLRPLARRAFKTARPPLVAIRARKPWVRLRRTTEGW